MSGSAGGGVASYVEGVCQRAKAASRVLLSLDSEAKNHALSKMAEGLRKSAEELKAANQNDLESGRSKGLSDAMLDRLTLSNARVEQMAAGLEEIALMRDPVGEIESQWQRPGGFEVARMRIPLGVIGIIYESRPNVTADASGLCFKAGNATILRGGSEAFHSNQAIAAVIRGALEECAIDPNVVQVIDTTDREAVGILLKQNQLVDVIIPRGGKSLIERVVRESTIPVIKHYEGICHVYVHEQADLQKALAIAVNAKVQRPGTCNAMETLLVDRAVAAEFLPELSLAFQKAGVKIYGCSETSRLIPCAGEATEENYRTEYLALCCNIRIVDSFEAAVAHIEEFGSNHTDVIVTESYATSRRFIREVDSSSVMVNASSRLADGAVYGLGAEIGISTDKLHAYGPMGVEELTTRKFVVFGDGTLRR